MLTAPKSTIAISYLWICFPICCHSLSLRGSFHFEFHSFWAKIGKNCTFRFRIPTTASNAIIDRIRNFGLKMFPSLRQSAIRSCGRDSHTMSHAANIIETMEIKINVCDARRPEVSPIELTSETNKKRESTRKKTELMEQMATRNLKNKFFLVNALRQCRLLDLVALACSTTTFSLASSAVPCFFSRRVSFFLITTNRCGVCRILLCFSLVHTETTVWYSKSPELCSKVFLHDVVTATAAVATSFTRWCSLLHCKIGEWRRRRRFEHANRIPDATQHNIRSC